MQTAGIAVVLLLLAYPCQSRVAAVNTNAVPVDNEETGAASATDKIAGMEAAGRFDSRGGLGDSPWNPYPIRGDASVFFSIVSFGAVGDNRTLNTEAIQRAIDTAGRSGGGYVVVPPGAFRTGSVNLTSNVYLLLQPGGVLQGSADAGDYNYDWDYWHVVQGVNVSNSGVIGPPGLPTGRGGEVRGCMWQMIDHYDPATNSFVQKTWSGERGCQGECRPKNLAFIDSVNITVAGVRLTHSSDWTQLFRRCTNVLEDRTWVEGSVQWGNNDGLDLESGNNITISNGWIKTGDDALAFRSGNCNRLNTPWPLPPDGVMQPLTGVTVRNMMLTSTSAAVKIAQLFQEHHGDIADISLANVTITETNRGIDILQRSGNGSFTNVTFTDMDIQTQFMTEPQFWGSGEPIVMSTAPGTEDAHAHGLKGFRDVLFTRVRARGENAILLSSLCQASTSPQGFQGVVFEHVQVCNG